MNSQIRNLSSRFGQFLKRTFLHNWGTKFVSLIFAVLLWHYAVLTLNTNRAVIVNDVPVTVSSSSTLRARGLVLSRSVEESLTPVRVTVNTPLSSAGAINAEQISVNCDLSSITSSGTYTLPLQARTNYGTVASVTPNSVTVEVEATATRNLPVDPVIQGSPAEGCVLGEVGLSATTITVTGPEALISTLDSASVTLSVENADGDIRRSVPIKLWDSDGDELSSPLLSLSQKDVILTIPISHTSSLPILAWDAVIGADTIPDGYEVTAIESFPESLQVMGSAAVLDSLAEQGGLTLSPIDVTGASSDVRSYCTVSLPDGATLVQNRSILVIVRIQRKMTTLTFDNVPVEIRGVDADSFTARSTITAVQVTVTGPESKMQSFTASHLQLYVDMSDRNAGTYTMPIHCLIDDFYEAQTTLSSETADVTLTEVLRNQE